MCFNSLIDIIQCHKLLIIDTNQALISLALGAIVLLVRGGVCWLV